ncbi:MAG: hypothetical protein JXA73_01365 [Acidobacteria bacterium]|nr:hypothetical protein [Acidobacteriota bacterium]
MSGDYSISLNGIYAAERNLLQSARRISAADQPDPADIIDINLARTEVKANLKAISAQQELDREILDLFG